MLNRFYDILLSIYLYNEKRGFIFLEELHLVFSQKFPQEKAIIASIRKHADDERHHHSLFEKYFRQVNRGAFAVGPWYGYCDQIVALIFGKPLDELKPD